MFRVLRSINSKVVHVQRFSTSFKNISVSEDDGVRNLKFINTKTRNAMSLETMDELLEGITYAQDEKNLRCIVISSTGPVFSAGHNLKELTSETGSDYHKLVFARCSGLMLTIRHSPVPVLAMVDGLAAAAGCQLVAACDIAICTERSAFSTPGASFGIFCSTPGIQVARTVNRMKTAQMLLTGLPVSSHEALAAGLVSQVVPDDKLEDAIRTNCDAIKSKSRDVIELGKRFFYQQIDMDIKSAYGAGEQVMVNNIASPDGQEGIQSFIEKRRPRWT